MTAKYENNATRQRYRAVISVKGAINIAGLNGEMAAYTTAMLDAGFGTDNINNDAIIGIMVIRMAELCGIDVSMDEKLKKYRQLGELLPQLLPIEGLDTVK